MQIYLIFVFIFLASGVYTAFKKHDDFEEFVPAALLVIGMAVLMAFGGVIAGTLFPGE